jgi:hypothetical protein
MARARQSAVGCDVDRSVAGSVNPWTLRGRVSRRWSAVCGQTPNSAQDKRTKGWRRLPDPRTPIPELRSSCPSDRRFGLFCDGRFSLSHSILGVIA